MSWDVEYAIKNCLEEKDKVYRIDICYAEQGTIDESCVAYISFQSEFFKTQILEVLRDNRVPTDCGHEYDCCGCWFRSSMELFYSGPNNFYTDGITRYNYILADHWSRNY